MNENSNIKLFLKYLFPSMLSTVFVSVYVITDTMMIGHGVGEDGLVALNIILPLFSLMYAIGYLFGVGGSVLMSVAKGQQDDKKADGIFTTSFIIVAAAAVMFTLLGSIFLEPLAVLLGADNDSMKLTLEYGRIMMATAFIYVFAPFFQSFVRNDNAPGRAMAAAVTGSLLNVVLDYIFIFILNMGMTGAIC
ncbi:MAG: MATE family efflux transporter, partial [Lachnospiraceae bacterium]|nr:MATE family efflux transporter [Lachnospiraceae bacterium]